MAKFTDIIGQEQLKEHLQNAIATKKVSHAYIINGERSSGKEFIARIFAMALQCEKGETEPCGECHSCKQALSNNQPDIVYVSHEKPNTIGVEDIRAQINGDIAIKPYSVVLNMKPVSDALVKKYLMEELAVPDYKANICVAFARGNIGKAKLLASSEEFEKVKDEAITLVKYINDMEVNEIVKAIKKITEYKFDVNDYLDILSAWYRDVLLFKATKDVNSLIFKEEIQQIMRVSDRSTYEGIETIVNALQQAKRRLEANVNFDLTMELLLLTIKEN